MVNGIEILADGLREDYHGSWMERCFGTVEFDQQKSATKTQFRRGVQTEFSNCFEGRFAMAVFRRTQTVLAIAVEELQADYLLS